MNGRSAELQLRGRSGFRPAAGPSPATEKINSDSISSFGFGVEKHDDAVDALVYLILGLAAEGIAPQGIHYV
jgi:hypothetical protein